MPRRQLTKTLIDSLHPTGRDFVIWDASAPGFGVRISAMGAKSYIQMYRAGRGRGAQLRKVTIGKTTDLTLSEARNIAARHRGDVARGDDPAGDAARKRREMTLKKAAELYVQEHVQVHNKPSWQKQIELLLRVHILPEFGSTRLSDITRGDIVKWHARKPAGHYGTNRCLAILRKILTIAQRDWEVISNNPASGVRLHRELPRDRFFQDAEIAAIGRWLASCESGAESAHFILATRLLLLTGMRLGEVMSLRWIDIDLPQNVIRLKDAKSGAPSVALNPEIVAYLGRCRLHGDFVVGIEGGTIPLTKGSYHAFWRRLVKGACLKNARPHDFRHTVATLGAIEGANAFVLRDLLGHKTIAITSGYVARTLDPVRAVSNSVGRHIGSALSSGSDSSGEVVALGRRK